MLVSYAVVINQCSVVAKNLLFCTLHEFNIQLQNKQRSKCKTITFKNKNIIYM